MTVDTVVVLVGFPRVVGPVFLGLLLLGGDFVVILCGGECWLFSSFLLSFPWILLFPPVCGFFALPVLVDLCSLVSLSLFLDRFFTCCGRLVVFRCGDGSVCCSCRLCVVPVRNPLVWWSYVRSVSTKSLRVGMLLHLSSPLSLVFVMQSRRMRWAGYAARVGWGAYRVLVGKQEWRRQCGRPWRRREGYM